MMHVPGMLWLDFAHTNITFLDHPAGLHTSASKNYVHIFTTNLLCCTSSSPSWSLNLFTLISNLYLPNLKNYYLVGQKYGHSEM